MTSAHVKFFLGFPLTSEIKMHLNQSPQWKEASLFQTQEMTEINFEGKEYIGFLLESPLLYTQLKNKEKDLKSQLQYYCSKIQIEKQKIYLFPQLFVA
jgi:hypothetical protein